MRIGRREFLGKIAAASASTLLVPSILDMLGGNALAGQIGSTYDLDEDHIAAILEKGLYRGGDFSELYFETINSLSFKLSERAFSEATVGFTQGAGVRT